MQAVNSWDLPDKSEAEQRVFFEAARDHALRAEEALGRHEQDLRVAGTIVRLVFAGPELRAKFLPALAHLCLPPQPRADAVLHVWESEESRIALPQCPCPSMCFTDRGDIWTMLSSEVKSAFNWGEHSLSLLDLAGKEGVFWVRSSQQLPFWTIASPFRTLFSWWIEACGGQLLHAAAVGTKLGGLLITGKGGVGKSTTALAALRAGFDYVADDYLVVTLDPSPTAHSLYCTAKVDMGAAPHFAEFHPQSLPSVPGVDPKAVMFLHPTRSDALALSLPLKAIVTPAFAQRADSWFEPAPARVIKNAAAFTTLCQLPHAGQHTLDVIDRLVAALPCHRLMLGSDVNLVPSALARFLEGESFPARPRPVAEPGTPLVSVVIPVHNGAHFLADAVASILAQAHPALEIIVVDDGSTDNLAEAVAALPVALRLFRQEAKGPAAARNLGIRAASGNLIAILDVDDLWPTDMLATAIDAFQADSALDVVRGHAHMLKHHAPQDRWTFVDNPEKSFPHYIGAAVYQRRAFDRVGLFDEKLRYAEDTDWFARAEHGGLAMKRLDCVSLIVRRHDSNMTAGKIGTEVVPLRFVKNLIDRQRAAGDEVAISRAIP